MSRGEEGRDQAERLLPAGIWSTPSPPWGSHVPWSLHSLSQHCWGTNTALGSGNYHCEQDSDPTAKSSHQLPWVASCFVIQQIITAHLVHSSNEPDGGTGVAWACSGLDSTPALSSYSCCLSGMAHPPWPGRREAA